MGTLYLADHYRAVVAFVTILAVFATLFTVIVAPVYIVERTPTATRT